MLRRERFSMFVALVAGTAASIASAQTATMPPHSTNFTGATRGYWFTAPVGFQITGVQVLQAASPGANPFTNWAIVKFNGNVPPPTFSATTNAFTTLGMGLDQAANTYLPVSIFVNPGDVIGIYGNSATGSGTTTGVNSYTAAGTPATTTILGNTVTMNRSGMQFHLGSATSPAGMHDIFAEPSATTCSRVEFTYAPLGVTGACCLGAPSYSCLVTTAAGCASSNGTYAGDNVTCAAANCPPPPTGGCCRTDGSCQLLTAAQCTAASGTYAGDNVSCAAANCPPGGACCRDSGCSVLTSAACTAAGGTWTAGPCTAACVPIAWIEVGDAGDTPATAQQVTGSAATPCQYISGAVGAGNADVYKICICDEANFLATTAGTTPATTIDTQLYIFDSTGHGLAMDDDDVGVTGTLQSRLTTQFVPSNGTYYLGISGYDNDPVDGTAQAIWLDQNATPAYGPEWAPNGPGAANAWTNFDNTAGASGTYKIALTGVCFCVPVVACYPNCDGSTSTPLLTANDFQCFLNEYAAGHSYANCDGSTNNPVLTANDFQCFLNSYAAGCT